MYASLLTLRRRPVKILTVEDPVECRLDGINQTGVEPRIGLDFAAVPQLFQREHLAPLPARAQGNMILVRLKDLMPLPCRYALSASMSGRP